MVGGNESPPNCDVRRLKNHTHSGFAVSRKGTPKATVSSSNVVFPPACLQAFFDNIFPCPSQACKPGMSKSKISGDQGSAEFRNKSGIISTSNRLGSRGKCKRRPSFKHPPTHAPTHPPTQPRSKSNNANAFFTTIKPGMKKKEQQPHPGPKPSTLISWFSAPAGRTASSPRDASGGS